MSPQGGGAGGQGCGRLTALLPLQLQGLSRRPPASLSAPDQQMRQNEAAVGLAGWRRAGDVGSGEAAGGRRRTTRRLRAGL